MMTGEFLCGVKIVNFENLPDLFICAVCNGPLIDHIGGWKGLDLGKVYHMNQESDYRFCAVCSKPLSIERRGGFDRREYEYEIHIPERRTAELRK
jgi:hypothetical protein